MIAARPGRHPRHRLRDRQPGRDQRVAAPPALPLRAGAAREPLGQPAPARAAVPQQGDPPGAQLGDRPRAARARHVRRGLRLGRAVPEGAARRPAHVQALQLRPRARAGLVATVGPHAERAQGHALDLGRARARARAGAAAAVEGGRVQHQAQAGDERRGLRPLLQGQVRRLVLGATTRSTRPRSTSRASTTRPRAPRTTRTTRTRRSTGCARRRGATEDADARNAVLAKVETRAAATTPCTCTSRTSTGSWAATRTASRTSTTPVSTALTTTVSGSRQPPPGGREWPRRTFAVGVGAARRDGRCSR